MASLLNLPLELVRPIIEYAILARDDGIPRTTSHYYVGFGGILRLREVNRLFDAEVLAGVARLGTLRRLARTNLPIAWHDTPWHPPRTGEEPAVKSETLFLARYLLGRPHAARDGWGANLSAYLNTLLDLVLVAEGRAVDGAERRPAYMLCLCRHFMRVRLAERLEQAPQFGFYRPVVMYSVDALLGDEPVAMGPLEQHLLTCQSVLDASFSGGLTAKFHQHPGFEPLLLRSKERGSQSPLGAGLQAFIVGSTMERFRAVLDSLRGLEFNDEDRDCLVWAVQSGELAKVQYLMTRPGHSPPHKPYGTKFELAVVEAIRLRRRDMVQYLFGLHQWTRGEGVPVRARVADVGFVTTMGLMVACRNGDLETVELFYRHIQPSELEQQHPHHRRNALMYACRSGNPELVAFLLRQEHIRAEVVAAGKEGERNCFMCTNGYRPTHYEGYGVCGGERWGFGPIFVAATIDDVWVAQMVVDAGHEVSAKQYQQAAVVAIDLGHHRFLNWLLDNAAARPALTTNNNPASDFDLLGMACVRGTVGVLEVLAAHGLLQDRVLWAEDCCAPYELDYRLKAYPLRRYERPALVALSWQCGDLLEFLLAQGGLAGVADPRETSVRDEWAAGCIPRRPSAKIKPAMWGAIESVTLEQAEFALEQTRVRSQG